MNFIWNSGDVPPDDPIPPLGWFYAVLRGGVLTFVLTSGMVATVLLRGPERVLYGLHRPWTPFITQWVCRVAFVILGMRFESRGTPMKNAGAVVSNHASWLDIFALNARKRIYFVSKSEVAGWPGIGTLAKITGTVFINRDPREAKRQKDIFESRLLAGHKLLFFPEGTSTDNMRVLPFKSALFQAFFTPDLRHEMYIQSVSLIYTAPEGADARFYGWWGDMEFGPHLLRVLASTRQGGVKVVYHPPEKVDKFTSRKDLAAHVEQVVRQGLPPERRMS